MDDPEMSSSHLYTTVKVARDDDLSEQIGRNIHFDLVDFSRVRCFVVERELSFADFKDHVSRDINIPANYHRYWIWRMQKDRTYRPYRYLTQAEEDNLKVGQLCMLVDQPELNLFLEIEYERLFPVAPPDITIHDMLLFFKFYDPKEAQLSYVGRLFVNSFMEPTMLQGLLKGMASLDPDEEIELFEETRKETCASFFSPTFDKDSVGVPFDMELSFSEQEISNGGIICIQKYSETPEIMECKYPCAEAFLKYIRDRQIVHFRSLKLPNDDGFLLELSMADTYEVVVKKMALKLEFEDHSKIRITQHNSYFQQPELYHFSYPAEALLRDMLVQDEEISDVLYYELLDIPLPELGSFRTLEVTYRHALKNEVFIIRLPKLSTVEDVLNEIREKVKLCPPFPELRLLAVYRNKIHKIFSLDEKIDNINDLCWTLRAEEIPEEEINYRGRYHRLIRVCHFTTHDQLVQNFGDPFFMPTSDPETLQQIKARIQTKLQVEDDEFCKWKFALVSMGIPIYLEDETIICQCLDLLDCNDKVDPRDRYYLGLEHSDSTPQ